MLIWSVCTYMARRPVPLGSPATKRLRGANPTGQPAVTARRGLSLVGDGRQEVEPRRAFSGQPGG